MPLLPRSFALALVLSGTGIAPAAAQTLSEQVLALTNVERWNNGQLPPFKGNAQLDAAATGHSQAMGVRDFFMHCDPDTGKAFNVRISDAGYAYNSAAENIAAGNSTAAATVAQWMGSSGHRANILGGYRELGVGYHVDAVDTALKRYTSVGGCTPNTTISGNFRHYWTQNFGTRSSVYPLVIDREAYATPDCSVALYVYGSGFATQMRFSNNGSTWSPWTSYTANATWDVIGSSGATVTVFGEIRNGSGTVRAAQDTIRLGVNCGSAGGQPPDRVFANGFEN